MERWLEHPLTRGRPLDSPCTTHLRRRIIAEKRFLRRIYEEWYRAISEWLPAENGPVLELGAGAGFLEDYIPHVIRSEVFSCPDISIVLDAQCLPFRARSLRAIVMTDVLHHIPDVRRFFAEAAVCVRPGGRLVMVEPWVTNWSRLIYGRVHHEPFRPDAGEWAFASAGPLSGANGALPWIVFERDRAAFEREFPEWRVDGIQLKMPLRYLLSGGVSLRSLMPGWTFGVWRRLEMLLQPWMHHLAMFAVIAVQRTDVPATQGA